MGVLNDYELTASLLAGGLTGTRERLTRAVRRLMACRRGEARDDPDHHEPDCRSPSWSAAISQALSDLTDAWQGRAPRPVRFRETERLFLLLKDLTLDAVACHPAPWSDYHSLAQCLSELRLDIASPKPHPRL
jgi:hypothetical protein